MNSEEFADNVEINISDTDMKVLKAICRQGDYKYGRPGSTVTSIMSNEVWKGEAPSRSEITESMHRLHNYSPRLIHTVWEYASDDTETDGPTVAGIHAARKGKIRGLTHEETAWIHKAMDEIVDAGKFSENEECLNDFKKAASLLYSHSGAFLEFVWSLTGTNQNGKYRKERR